MNSKERVLTSLKWQEPDRVPIQIYLTPEMRAKLAEYFNGQDILECLGVDFRFVNPVYRGKIHESHASINYDMWGTGYKSVSYGKSGSYNEAVVLPLAELDSMEKVENYPWPDPDDFDYSCITEQCKKYDGFAICLGGAGYPDILNGTSFGRGMEQVLIDIAMRDEAGMAIIDKRVNICYEILRRSLEASRGQIDILYLGEDTGNQNGRMVSPKDFDEVFKPRLKRFYDLAHEYGAKAMMHSCGDTHSIMPAFIEMGLDILDSMQPEPAGMDPETIRNVCLGKLAFCGLISTQRTLPYGSVEECRMEARHRLDVIAKGGGYIFCSSHCIQADTPLENVLAAYGEALGKKLM